jgi:hypothetical protein
MESFPRQADPLIRHRCSWNGRTVLPPPGHRFWATCRAGHILARGSGSAVPSTELLFAYILQRSTNGIWRCDGAVAPQRQWLRTFQSETSSTSWSFRRSITPAERVLNHARETDIMVTDERRKTAIVALNVYYPCRPRPCRTFTSKL